MPHIDDGTLEAWLDRDRSGLTAVEAAEVERHLAECQPCMKRLEMARATRARADAILLESGPVDLSVPDFDAILDRAGQPEAGAAIRTRSAERRRTGRMLYAAAWAASIVASLGIGWFARDLPRGDRIAFESVAVREGEPGAIGPGVPSAMNFEDSADARTAAGTVSADDLEESISVRQRAELPPAASGTESGGGNAFSVESGEIADLPPPPVGGRSPVEVRRSGTDAVELPSPVAAAADDAAPERGLVGVSAAAPAAPAKAAAPPVPAGPEADLATAAAAPPSAMRRDAVRADAMAPDAAVSASLESRMRGAPILHGFAMSAAAGWMVSDLDAVERTLGVPALLPPGLEVVRIEIPVAIGVAAARITFELPGGERLVTVQSRSDTLLDALMPDENDPVVVLDRGELTITAMGILSPDRVQEIFAADR